MRYLQIPSFPPYEINKLCEVRHIRSKRPARQSSDGFVCLYNKAKDTITHRSPRKLYQEALTHYNSQVSSCEKSYEKPQVISRTPFLTDSETNLLESLINRVSNEDLSADQCIDLIKVLLTKKKSSVTDIPDKKKQGYITPEELKAIYEKVP